MHRTRIVIPIIASAGLALLCAAPASAATDANFSITGGALSITAPTGAPVALGSAPASAAAQSIGAALGDVTVTDGRGGVAGWVASVISTAFTPPAPAIAVSANAVTYTTPVATKTGTSTVTAQDAPSPIGVKPVQTATGVSGANSATWNPTVTVLVPAGAQPGVYSATLTHSVV